MSARRKRNPKFTELIHQARRLAMKYKFRADGLKVTIWKLRAYSGPITSKSFTRLAFQEIWTAGRISCIVPEKDGAEDEVKVSVQVYDEKAMQPNLNSCFSHGEAPLSGGQSSMRKENIGKTEKAPMAIFVMKAIIVAMFPLITHGGGGKKCSGLAEGTRPDKDSSCGECVCLRGMKETGTDAFQRRTCERVFECSKRTQPMIYKVLADSPVSEGDEIELKGRWRRGRNVEAKCLFYTADDVAVAVNQPTDNRALLHAQFPLCPFSYVIANSISHEAEPTTSVPTTPPSFNENGDYDQDYNNGGLDYGGDEDSMV